MHECIYLGKYIYDVITKTGLSKYIENFHIKNWTF